MHPPSIVDEGRKGKRSSSFTLLPQKCAASLLENSSRRVLVSSRIEWSDRMETCWTVGTGSLSWCFVIHENSIGDGSTGGDRPKRKSCFVWSLRRVERKTTRRLDKPVLADRSSVHLLCVCVYTRSFYRTRTVVGISICIRYPPTIESNPGFLQNCNFLRFHAFRRKQYLSRLHVKSIKMRRYVLFYLGKVYCALSSFSFFFIFDEIRNVR